MIIGCLGSGAWGFTLANLLAGNGFRVNLWSRNKEIINTLIQTHEHPRFPGHKIEETLHPMLSLEEVLKNSDIILESVTTTGIREVLQKILTIDPHFKKPLILTTKGIEQHSGFLIDELVLDVMGASFKEFIGCLSGPSIAKEVMRKLPTSCVCSAYSQNFMDVIQKIFSNPFFRVYPNADIHGIEFGGAMKNPIAIACGISDGLGFGTNTKSALMTRGLHEIRKLSIVKGAKPETLNGLAGLGDLCTTCLSEHSRNYRFGFLLAEGVTPEKARENIGMVIEGANTCISALELGKKSGIEMPITKAVYEIIYQNVAPKDAVKSLLNRAIKEEHL